jgi:hypothetical protein
MREIMCDLHAPSDPSPSRPPTCHNDEGDVSDTCRDCEAGGAHLQGVSMKRAGVGQAAVASNMVHVI